MYQEIYGILSGYIGKQKVENQSNVDIKENKNETSGDKITLSMTLWQGGTLSYADNKYVFYHSIYNTSNTHYMIIYSNV